VRARLAAPPPLDLIEDLVNTRAGPVPREALLVPADLATWCRAHGAAVVDHEVTDDDLRLARVVREGLRAALARHSRCRRPEDAAAERGLQAEAGALHLRVTLLDEPALTADRGGARAVLATALAAAVSAGQSRWRRLRICRNPRCRSAFYDRSRNGSGVWCSMAVCGTASKHRTFVDRRRAGDRPLRHPSGAGG
jgi:predicted RNA-binding Zn ribbon-like protein